MSRRLLVALLGSSLLGCTTAGDRTVGRAVGPVGLKPIDPVMQKLNGGGPPATPAVAERPGEGRPAPFASQSPPGPRPQLPGPPTADPAAQPAAGETVPEPLPPIADPGVRPASFEPTGPAPSPAPAAAPPSNPAAARTEIRLDAGKDQGPPGKLLGLNVARVGDVYISWSELNQARKDLKRDRVPDGQQVPPHIDRLIAKQALNHLVDSTLLMQEARRAMGKNAKMWEALEKAADEKWQEKEVKPLLRKYDSKDIYELRVKLEERGLSLDRIRETYKREFISNEFLMMKLHSKLRPTLKDQERYYREHLGAFDRPPQVTWNEVLVRIGADRVAARRKADQALDRIRRGEAFEAVAKALSEGPTAEQGGKWATEPGSHAAPSVNQALATLPLRQVSQVFECPDGYRIVRVEARREGGPAPFTEVQDEVFKAKFQENYEREVTAFLDKLRADATIQTINFDDPPPG